jgi:hypothetical protein
VRATVVLGILDEVERDNTIIRGHLFASVLAKAKRAVQ